MSLQPSPLELLHSRWSDLIFRDFSLLAQQLGGISSEKVNSVLSTTLSQGDPKVMISWLRLIIALHFQLGKLAEFTLNDRTFTALLQIVERSVQQQQQQQGGVPQVLSDLCVSLLSLNTATAVSTVGIENQLCALFMVSSANHQRVLLPLVHRSFYSSPSSSLSADTFQAMIRRQSLDAGYHEFLRLFALVHASRGVLDDFTCKELLSTSPVGNKPMLGSAPIALGLDGTKCSNNRLGAASALRDKRMSGGDKQPLPFFTLLYHLDNPTNAQVHHCYVVSAYGHAFRRALRQLTSNPITQPNENEEGGAPRQQQEHQSEGQPQIPFIRPPLMSLGAADELSHYLHDVFQQLGNFINGRKCAVFCSKRGLGLMYVESVVSECLFVAKHLCLMHHGTQMAQELAAEVTNFLYCAMHAVRTNNVKAPTDEVPELRDSDISISYSAGASGRVKENESVGSSIPSLAPGGSAIGDPLFSPDVMIKCLEFQIAVAPIEEVLNFFQDIFGSRMWDAYLERHESFALELCLALERNAMQLRDVLPTLAPRVMWLLSQQPHVLFPVVKRLIQPMMSPSTNLDIFFRIVFLPLICFSNSYAPPSAAAGDDAGGDSSYGGADNFSDAQDDEYHGMSTATFSQQQDIAAEHAFFQDLWGSITDWSVDTRYQHTHFAELCMMQGKAFGLWDALHRSMGYFDGRMTIAYRLIRPLMTEYFKALDHMPSQIFSALRTAYLFMVSPIDQRAVVTDYLLEMGRWIAEVRPTLVLQSTSALVDAMQQEFIPPQKRSWQLQRWAAMVGATGLSLMSGEDDCVVQEAAAYFEVLHVTLWELVALASTVVTIQYQASLTPTGRTERDVSSASYKTGVHTMHFAQSVLSTSASSDILSSSTPYDGGLAADYIPEARLALTKKVAWDDVQTVWAAPNGLRSHEMCGLVFTEHMHSLVIALAMFSQICPNVKERGIICLANLIRTLLKSKHSGSQLATNAAICLKLLKFPTMSGLNTMPLHALLGLQVLRDGSSGAAGSRPGPPSADPTISP